jgi:two-component system sensor histidine kinase/response regulator
VRVANNGREAVDALEERPFDLVLMDVQMPVMDGLEATAIIRAREQATGRHVPIIAVTAHAIKGDRERFLNAGMDGYVSKPIRTEELWGQVRLLVPHLLAECHPGGAAPPSPPPAFDRQGALESVGGDRAVLGELIGVFREDSVKLLADAAEALRAADAGRLGRAAHTLKGSLEFFNAPAAAAAASRLEAMGRQADLSAAPQTIEELSRELDHLLVALAQEIESR